MLLVTGLFAGAGATQANQFQEPVEDRKVLAGLVDIQTRSIDCLRKKVEKNTGQEKIIIAELARMETEHVEAQRLEAEKAAAEQAALEIMETSQQVQNTSQSGGYSYQSGEGVLTKSGGVNYYNGYKETYYSQRVLPGGGLNIPGRHVAADGTIRDGDGYIVVASDRQGKGETGTCSLGNYKVYDTGVGHDGVDIYTDW